jgi:hypothetical protein
MTPTITVKFASISPTELQSVLDYYNSIKPSHYEALAELDRCEGGFQIALSESEKQTYDRLGENDKIKQLRWKRRKLDSCFNIGFNREETQLLYQSLVHVFTESLVVLEI